jgi:hypothetical protein
MHSRTTRLTLLVAALALTVPVTVRAQYFGQNKVAYRDFDFREMHTPHFDIYYYTAESLATADVARMAERWYERHSATLRDTFPKKPIVLFSDPPAFSQQNIAYIPLGGPVGGVTEPIRNRAIIPMSPDYHQTDHVLGHELVHTFQFDIAENIRGPGGGGIGAFERIPLWATEGMAEYLSIGRDDPNSAMYLRDAVLRNDIPALRRLGRGNYFIYRWGQIFWAYVGGKYGDDVIPRLFRQALRTGFEPAVRNVLGMSTDSLSREMAAAIRREVTPQLNGLVRPENVGDRPLQPMSRRYGDIDVGPALSPDGKYVSFFTQRGLFQIDLYVADVETGRIVHKLTSINSNPHYDALNFGGSAGSWSPDGQRLAVGVYAKGKEMIGIFNVQRGGLERKIDVPEVTTAEDISWGVDDKLAFSGNHGGITDLYVYDLKTGKTTQVTDDKFAQIQPAWSPDGKYIAYVTDSGTTDMNKLAWGPLHVEIRDMTTGTSRTLPTFPGAKAINPQWTPDGKGIYFVADRNGIPDIYRENVETGEITQITRIATGVTGILPMSATMTVARTSGRIMFDVFAREGYELHRLDPEAAAGTPLAAEQQGDTISIGVLPPTDVPGGGAVTARIADASTALPPEHDFPSGPYHPSFGLEYLGSPGVGVAVGGPFGSGLAGGVSAYFGDQLENNVLAAQLAGSGQIQDFGGEVLYINQAHRLIYGASVGHIPYLTGGTFVSDTTLPTSGGGSAPGQVIHEVFERAFYETGTLFAQYPFSQYRRLELSAGYTYLHYQITQDEYITDNFGNVLAANYNQGFPGTPPGLSLWQTSIAYATDYTTFGFTSPIAGARYRFEVDPTFGNLLYTTVLADYRRYLFANPVTFAFRLTHYGRYGRDAEDSTTLFPLYVGDPYFIRGYDYNTININECKGPTVANGGCPVLDRLFGSKIAAANFEIRFPLTGVAQYGLINFPYLPIDVAPFFDAGVAWYNHDTPVFKFSENSSQRIPVFSSGISTRINVLGYIVAEVFWAYPFQRPMQKSGIWGFQILPGW